MSKTQTTQTTLLIIILVILSGTVLTLLGVFVIQPAIHDRLANQQPTPVAILLITPGSADGGGGSRFIEIRIDAMSGPLNITEVYVEGLGVQALDTPSGSSVIGTVIEENATDMVYIVGSFIVGTKYHIYLYFTSGEHDIVEDFKHIA